LTTINSFPYPTQKRDNGIDDNRDRLEICPPPCPLPDCDLQFVNIYLEFVCNFMMTIDNYQQFSISNTKKEMMALTATERGCKSAPHPCPLPDCDLQLVNVCLEFVCNFMTTIDNYLQFSISNTKRDNGIDCNRERLEMENC